MDALVHILVVAAVKRIRSDGDVRAGVEPTGLVTRVGATACTDPGAAAGHLTLARADGAGGDAGDG